MLKPLRIKLTLLYLLVAMLLAGFVGVSAYSLLYFYFQNNNDSALLFKMADTFNTIGVKLPEELELAQQNWLAIRSNENSSENDESEQNEHEDDDADDDDDEHENELSSAPQVYEAYEGELTSIFILPLDNAGNLIFNPNPFIPPMNPDINAVNAALQNGSDLRNGILNDGTPVRLLTYRVPSSIGYDLIQVGKPIGDQIRVLNQLVGGLLLVGAVSILLLGFGSWWMAGRSLRATQYAWEMQQAFVANASHELRTPLTLMRASAEVAQRRSKEDMQQTALMKDIIHEVDHMSQLVEDLLLLSRLDARQLKLEKNTVLLSDLAAEIQRQFMPLASERQVTLVNQTAPAIVLADRTRLRQVLIILLDNALRHTPPGGTVTIQSVTEGRNLRISVNDSGEGIPSQHLAHVFERFYQVQNARSGENNGNGLGLSIARSLVEAQNGQIRIASQTGKGTSVSFTLPLGKV
jgi:signal transduction histidine kinase